MRKFVQVGLDEHAAAEPIRRAAEELTARSLRDVGAVHRQLARNSDVQDR
jgi:hypothetical protein